MAPKFQFENVTANDDRQLDDVPERKLHGMIKKYVFQNLCPIDGDKEDLGKDEAGREPSFL